MCKFMYDCSYIMRANMKYEAVNGCKCYSVKRCNIVVTSKPWICGVLQTRMISACKTKYVTHGFDLNSNEGTSQS